MRLASAILALIAVVIGLRLWRRWRLDRDLAKVVDFERDTPLSEHRLIYDLLRYGFKPEDLWHDLYVPKGDGHYAQVDAVALTDRGVIVFEVKDYRGKIYGDEYSYRWKQYVPGHREPRTFYSPVRQNAGHVRALRKQLSPLGRLPYWSVVVFYGDCRLKDTGDLPEDTYVLRAKRLKRTLRDIRRNGRKVEYTAFERLEERLDIFASYGADEAIKSEHIDYVASLRYRPSWIVRFWRWLWRLLTGR